MTPMTALLGFTAWTLLLVMLVFAYRGLAVLKGTPINNWPRTKKPESDPGFVRRADDAHANALENLPIFAVIVLAAYALDRPEAIAAVAPLVLYARIGQSVMHLIGTSKTLVFFRASFWTVQLVLFFWMLWRLAA